MVSYTHSIPADDLVRGFRATCPLRLTMRMRAELATLLTHAEVRPVLPVDRIRALGEDLFHLRDFAALLEHRSAVTHENKDGAQLSAVAAGMVAELNRLVRRLDDEVGLASGQPWRPCGLRATFMVHVRCPSVRCQVQRLLDDAYAEHLERERPSVATPRESLRALTAELTCLAEFARSEPAPCAREVGEECRRIAGALRLWSTSTRRGSLRANESPTWRVSPGRNLSMGTGGRWGPAAATSVLRTSSNSAYPSHSCDSTLALDA